MILSIKKLDHSTYKQKTFHGYLTQVHRPNASLRNFLEKSLLNLDQKKKITNRRFVGAGGQALDPVGIFNLPFTCTDKERRSMTVQNDVIVMKTLNSGAIMGLDLIRTRPV
jgi:hypothetical protein